MAHIDEAALPEGVTLGRGHGDLPVLRIETPAARAEVYLLGATVTEWTPAGADPVIWVSEQALFRTGTGIRGGIPLCAPWFGPGLSKDKKPTHGWFRTAEWALADAESGADGVTLRFTLDGADADVPDGEPADIRGEYVVTVGTTLTTSLTVTAGADGLELEDAMHTYFAVSDVREVTVTGLDGARYFDKAPGGRAVNAQSGDVTFTRETDRVYQSTGPVGILDPGKKRRITLTKDGSASTVVWNPWTAKAADMADFGDDEWPSMLCVETANALAGHVTLEAGASHTTTATLSLEAL